MITAIEKSGTGIEKSGTGIEKSGTGIEKSGTGIGKSGTGCRRGQGWKLHRVLLSLCLLITTFGVQASGPRALVTESGGLMRVSVHHEQGIFVGSAPVSQSRGGLLQIHLHDAFAAAPGDCQSTGLMTQGSGTGSVKPCAGKQVAWGLAEVVSEQGGVSVLVSRISAEGPVEVLAAFQSVDRSTEHPMDSDRLNPADRWLTQY